MADRIRRAQARRKLSTTVSPETHRYLGELVKDGRAGTIAEAVDLVVRRAQRAEQRTRPERDTTAYFENMPAAAANEEARLAAALAQSVDEIRFDE
jgi:hypothetical protein